LRNFNKNRALYIAMHIFIILHIHSKSIRFENNTPPTILYISFGGTLSLRQIRSGTKQFSNAKAFPELFSTSVFVRPSARYIQDGRRLILIIKKIRLNFQKTMFILINTVRPVPLYVWFWVLTSASVLNMCFFYMFRTATRETERKRHEKSYYNGIGRTYHSQNVYIL